MKMNQSILANQLIKRGDIYTVDTQSGKGSEQGGYRPVLVLQNDIGNKYSPTIIVAMITTKLKKTTQPTHVKILAESSCFNEDSVIMLEQIKTIDKTRIKKYIGSLNSKWIKEIDKSLLVSLGIGVHKTDLERQID